MSACAISSIGMAHALDASGTISAAGPLRNIAPTITGPTPNRRPSRVAVNAPTMAPRFPMPSTTPIVATSRPRSRTTYTRYVENAMLLNRLDVAVLAAMVRR